MHTLKLRNIRQYSPRVLVHVLVVALGILLSATLFYAYKAAPVATGYAAKYLCSHVFIAGQDAGEAMESFVRPVNKIFDFVTYEVDYEERAVTTKLLGFLRPTTALYREDCGCTVLVELDPEALAAQTQGLSRQRPVLPDTVWPVGNRMDPSAIPAKVDTQRLNRRLAREFVETSDEPGEKINTLSIVVAYQDRIIAEHYRPGITDSTPLLSWSASKSITSALIGRLVQTSGLDIYQPAALPGWEADERRNITIDHLLRMESGLDFDERYAPLSNAVEMLYESPAMAAYAAARPLAASPGTRWSYSSGTTNLLAGILLEWTGGTLRDLEAFAHDEFFRKLGMTTAVFEHDERGAFVGSSYFHASAKDWLRFCLLYKNEGRWNGEQLLPEGWVDYSLRPTPHAPDGRYGAQIWLNVGADGDEKGLLPRLPADTFVFQGYQGQWFVVIPSKDLMIARFGVTNTRNWSMEALVLDILETIDYSKA